MRTLTKLILREATSTPPRRPSPTVSASPMVGSRRHSCSSKDCPPSTSRQEENTSPTKVPPKRWLNTVSYLLQPFAPVVSSKADEETILSTSSTKGLSESEIDKDLEPCVIATTRGEDGLLVEDGFLSMMLPTKGNTNRATASPPLLTKAPTGPGGHVLYPNIPHSSNIRRALKSIFGAGDDRAMPSLQYEIDWSLARLPNASLSSLEAPTKNPQNSALAAPLPSTVLSSVRPSFEPTHPTLNTLTEYLRSRFVQSSLDAQSQAWLKKKAVPSVIRGSTSAWLQTFLSRTSANAVAGRGEMFVVSREQVIGLLRKYDQRSLNGHDNSNKEFDEETPQQYEVPSVDSEYYSMLRIPNLVDIGAGDGGATHEYASELFQTMYATEDNYPMQWRLWQRGFKVVDFPSCLLGENQHSKRILGSIPTERQRQHGILPTTSTTPNSRLSSAPMPTTLSTSHVTTVIALMNVLDRADKAMSLLKAIVQSMERIDSVACDHQHETDHHAVSDATEQKAKEGPSIESSSSKTEKYVPATHHPNKSLFLMAVVLPWCPFVETNTKKLPPSEPLPMAGGKCVERAHFETSLATLVSNVIIPCGLEVVAWTRVPYLCEGSAVNGYYRLDDAVLLMRRR